MSLYNHALSVVCRRRRRLYRQWRRHRHLCTALPVTGLIIEASYAHEILSQCDIYFLNGGHFSKFLYLALLSTWLNLEPSYLTQLCTYTGASHREEIIHLSIIFLKLWIFKKIFTFYTFWLIGKHAKDTKFISGTPHTDTCTDRQIPIYILLI